MKKILFLLMLFSLPLLCSAQKKWRVINFATTNGVSLNGKYLTTNSVSLDYELKNDYSISSWNGISYNTAFKSGWISSQVTLNKRFNKFVVGGGVMYGSGNVGTPLPDGFMKHDFIFISTVSYRIRL